MKTELNPQPATITPGVRITVLEYNLRNFRVHAIMEQVSRLLLYLLECDSNNTSSVLSPREVRNIRKQWEIVKGEFDFSVAHNDMPQGSHEYSYKLLLIDQTEILKMKNVKLKRVVSELFNASRAIVSADSSSSQGVISVEDQMDFKLIGSLIDDVMERWIGTGEDTTKVGLSAPDFKILGEVSPSVNLNYAEVLEPSRSTPASKLPDVADV